MLQDAYDQQIGLKNERSMVITAITTMRVLLGLFSILSGIANYIYFRAPGGFLETVTQSKLALWGWGFSGIGPLPAFLAALCLFASCNRNGCWSRIYSEPLGTMGRHRHDANAPEFYRGVWFNWSGWITAQ